MTRIRVTTSEVADSARRPVEFHCVERPGLAFQDSNDADANAETPAKVETAASLIVPVLEDGGRLYATLTAALDQTVENYEVICVDRGATGAARDLLDRFAEDPRLRIVMAEGADAAEARSAGFAATDTPFLGFCEPGAWWRPGKLMAHLRHMSDDPFLGVSLSPAERVPAGRRPSPLRSVFPYKPLSIVDLLSLPADDLGATAVIRRPALIDAPAVRMGREEPGVGFHGPNAAEAERDAWLRIAQSTLWRVAAIPATLTLLHAPAAVEAERPAAPDERTLVSADAGGAFGSGVLARAAAAFRPGRRSGQ